MMCWNAGRVVSVLCLSRLLFSVLSELMACFETLGNSKSLFLQKCLIFSCFYLWASHCWCFKSSVLVPQLPDILSCFLSPFHFCLVCKSLAQRSLYALCPVCFVSTKDVLHFQGGSLKCHHVRCSQNFHLCLCANYYQFVYCFHHGSCILIILVLNSEFCHSNVSNLLELGSNTCSDSDFKLFCYCLPFSISHVYTNICNLSKIYFGKIYWI